MTQEAGTPPGFWDRIQQTADRAVDAAMRSGPLKNASISGGGITIKGGFLRLLTKIVNGVELFYVGPSGSVLGDGNIQQILTVRRSDGTVALTLYDAFPDPDGTLHQALNWWDRSGNVVMADDTDGGQGLARPWLSGGFVRTRYTDMSVATASTTFETLWDQKITKQQPRLEVGYRATMDTSGSTGETRVLVNGVALNGTTNSEAFAVATHTVGPAAVAGAHMSDMTVEIQARVVSGAGTIKVEPIYWKGRQS